VDEMSISRCGLPAYLPSRPTENSNTTSWVRADCVGCPSRPNLRLGVWVLERCLYAWLNVAGEKDIMQQVRDDSKATQALYHGHERGGTPVELAFVSRTSLRSREMMEASIISFARGLPLPSSPFNRPAAGCLSGLSNETDFLTS